MTQLCPRHQEEFQSWLDYRVRARFLLANGAARDDTSDGLSDRRAIRYEGWKSTIEFQQQLIRAACARECPAAMSVRIGSLFTGAGALCELAVAPLLGGRVAWHCENDPAASQVLAAGLSSAPNLGDITAVDWSATDPVDVLVGGFPCRDISSAGRKAGIGGQHSGLWSFFAAAIRALRPSIVIVENVADLVVRGLDRVLSDLAALGFDAEWTTLRASDVGAPHRRARIVLVAADPASQRWRPLQQVNVTEHGVAADGIRSPEPGRRDCAVAKVVKPTVDALLPTPAATDARGGRNRTASRRNPKPTTATTGSTLSDAIWEMPAEGVGWGKYGPAITRWEAIVGRPPPPPVMFGPRGGKTLNPALSEWMMGWPAGWVTAVPGITANDQKRLCGNGVVPQQIQAAVSYLLPFLSAEGRAA